MFNPLEFILSQAYLLVGDYGWAILLFAVLVRVVLFPTNLAAHKNALRFLKLQPTLNLMKIRFAADREALYEEQNKLFKKEGYNPFVGLMPLILQLLIVVGMLQAMYGFIEQMAGAAMPFLGLDLGETPLIGAPSPLWVIPVLSGVTAVIFCFFQTVLSPGALGQGRAANLGLTVFTVIFSLYFAFVTPAGVGLYWTAGNVLGVFVLLILNAMYNPRHLATEALAAIRAARKSPIEKKESCQRQKALAAREKADAARFMAADKRLVFYALSGGQYKYYKTIIDYLIEHSDIIIHYLSNDPDDAVFARADGRLVPYYAGQRKTMSLMLKLETDILATTVQGLSTYHFKRSMAKSDIEYIYIEHGPASTHLTARAEAYDRFDTIFCTGPHHVAEMRRREEMAGLPRKTLVKAGYGLYDQLAAAYAEHKKAAPDVSQRPQILVAPSWQADNIMELCLDEVLEALIGRGFKIIVRPHPQYVRMFAPQIKQVCDRYAAAVADGELVFETDFSGNEAIFTSDVLITDWSGIAFEFSYCTLRPSIFVNTPMKVTNPDWESYGLPVLDISLRGQLGLSLDVAELGQLGRVAEECIAARDDYGERISRIVEEYLFYPGRSGEIGGKYIMRRISS